jgi:hypothetical protein
MNKKSEFPFDRARRVTPEENQKFREAISEQCLENLRQSNRQLALYNLCLDDAISQIDSKLCQYKRTRLSSQEHQTPPTIELQG